VIYSVKFRLQPRTKVERSVEVRGVEGLEEASDRAGIARAAEGFRHLIDLAIARGGSYFLTCHRWARPDKLLSCHPRIPEFMAPKRRYDPRGVFQSEWYRQYGDVG
jgi:hypothetical protein